jgi:hypothetical protein
VLAVAVIVTVVRRSIPQFEPVQSSAPTYRHSQSWQPIAVVAGQGLDAAAGGVAACSFIYFYKRRGRCGSS